MRSSASRTAVSPLAGAAAFLATLGGCAGATPEGGSESGAEPGAEPGTEPTAARYMTHLLFAGAGGDAFFASFDQSAESGRLVMRYDASRGATSGWETLLDVRDTLPIPRAAWRILPADEMAVRVGDEGQVVGLTFAPRSEDEGAIRLEAGEALSVWTGPTGQRESLGVAALVTDDGAEPGILFFRRAARALGIPADGGETRAFVLADSLGNGLLLQVGEVTEPVSARTWLHGAGAAWSEILFEALPDSAPRAWRFAIAGTDLSGIIRAPGPDSSADDSAFRIECTLQVGDERFRFVGASARLAFP